MPDPFAPFHRAAIPTSHGPALTPGKAWSRWPTTLVALLLFATTTLAAVVAATGNHAPTPQLWKQSPPSIFTKASDGAEFRELLF
jgi:hypothetical protein